MIQSPLPAKRAHWWPRSQFPCVSQAPSHRVCGIKSPPTLAQIPLVPTWDIIKSEHKGIHVQHFLYAIHNSKSKDYFQVFPTNRWTIRPVIRGSDTQQCPLDDCGTPKTHLQDEGRVSLVWGIGNLSPGALCSFMTIMQNVCGNIHSHYTRKSSVQKCGHPIQTRRGCEALHELASSKASVHPF